MNEELIKNLKNYYKDDLGAILRKLMDVLNISLDDAKKLYLQAM